MLYNVLTLKVDHWRRILFDGHSTVLGDAAVDDKCRSTVIPMS